jgi:hypothetical protein
METASYQVSQAIAKPPLQQHTPKAKKRKTGDEIWKELLVTPKSQILLRLMADEALKEHKEGKTTEGGFGLAHTKNTTDF